MRLFVIAITLFAKASLLANTQQSLAASEIMTQDEMSQIGLANATPEQKRAFEQWAAKWTKEVLQQSSSYRSGENISSWIRRWPSYAAPNKTNLTQEDVTARQQHNQRIDKVINDGEIIELKDGSNWLIGPVYRYITTKWQRDQEVEVSPSEDMHFKYTLHNKSTDEFANANMKAAPSPTGQRPEERVAKGNSPLKNISINGDVVVLGNGTSWNIAPLDMFRVKNWKENDRILAKPSNDPFYRFRLTNLDSGETALASPQEAGSSGYSNQKNY
jgi:hypothetical protein